MVENKNYLSVFLYSKKEPQSLSCNPFKNIYYTSYGSSVTEILLE